MNQLPKIIMLAILVLALGIASAFATPVLQITDPIGGSVVTISDNSALDSDLDLGVIVFNGVVGDKWKVITTAGTTKPYEGSAVIPNMHLNSFDATTTTGGGSLIVEFSDVNFGTLPDSFNFEAAIGGVTPGTVSYATYLDPLNRPLYQFAPALTSEVLGGGAFSSTEYSAAVAGNYPYSLTQVVTIAHSGKGMTSIDASLAAVPEPSTLLLLGSGFALVGLVQLRRRK